MPEEKPVVQDPVLIALTRMEEKNEARFERLEAGFGEMKERQARLEGGFEQMDKRIGRIETTQGQILWSMVSGFLITITAVLLAKLL